MLGLGRPCHRDSAWPFYAAGHTKIRARFASQASPFLAQRVHVRRQRRSNGPEGGSLVQRITPHACEQKLLFQARNTAFGFLYQIVQCIAHLDSLARWQVHLQ